MNRVAFKAEDGSVGERLDRAVAQQAAVSRAAAAQLIQAGRVLVNGKPAKPSHRLAAGEHVQVQVALPPALSAAPEEIPLEIVYQDADLAVLDKPAGIVMHPAAGHYSGTLANALAAQFPNGRQVGAEERPGIVHRLDKDTSGLLVVALNPNAYASLQHQIAERSAQRRYLALATGHVEPSEGVIEAPIGRDVRNRKRMAVHGIGARPARTSYRVLEYLSGFTLLEATLHSGRTHQIRVHLAAIGHPIAGDKTYKGASLPGLDRQFLHAYKLAIRSPSTGEALEFTSPLRGDLEQIIAKLRND